MSNDAGRDDALPERHQTSIVGDGRGVIRAFCLDCTWTGPDRATVTEACRDGEAHEAARPAERGDEGEVG